MASGVKLILYGDSFQSDDPGTAKDQCLHRQPYLQPGTFVRHFSRVRCFPGTQVAGAEFLLGSRVDCALNPDTDPTYLQKAEENMRRSECFCSASVVAACRSGHW